MIKSSVNIGTVKKAIEKCLNEDVAVKVNLGRNKYVSYKGRITNVYPALFTVSPYGEFNISYLVSPISYLKSGGSTCSTFHPPWRLW